jgi:glycosyltransferase involved in cell wall biosynthesis
MNGTPVISVIVPCYNHGRFLDEALQSVHGQTFPGWECFIIDDGSADDTKNIALSWCQKDERFKYIYKENGGLSSARNRGLKEVKGEYLQFLDADDMIAANKFEFSLQQGDDAGIIITGFNFTHEKNKQPTTPSFSLNRSLFNFYSILTGWDEAFVIPIHSGLFKSSLFTNIRFNETLRAKEDWLMWLQVYQSDFETVYIDQPLALYRTTGNSMSQDRALMNQNLILAYRLIFDITPPDYREVFFTKVMDTLSQIIFETEELLGKTRQSRSYRLGNFWVRNFNKLRNPG